ncbi:MAG: glutamate racemase, partial [Treponema sp.]|nr:glutamate racemase [Treponema sp.]
MNTSTRPYIDFAFLDSGTGGIPYMLELKEKSPESRCIYLGDTLHFPYGEKSSGQILACASSAVKLIVEKWNPRAIVVACNTISVTTLPELRTAFPSLPIVGTVPAIRLAARVTKNKRIGLL